MKAADQQAHQSLALEVLDLSIIYETASGDVQAVSDVSFQLFRGETLGVVGESGCGKSTVAMGVLQLINPPGRRTNGSITLNNKDLTGLDETALREQRWTELALIPQGAMNSLNPTMTVGAQLRDVIRTHKQEWSQQRIRERVEEVLMLVGLPSRIYRQYPHELSGGMKQRVCIAMAVALEPDVIIADEATSALDVVVQRLVAQTLMEVKQRLSVAMILIGHDMGLMAQMTDRLMVMYAGKVVEIGPTEQLLQSPAHPYTRLLIDALPSLSERKPMKSSEGIVHDPRNPPPGCIFQLRCPYVQAQCRTESPAIGSEDIHPAAMAKSARQVACHFPLSANPAYQSGLSANIIDQQQGADNPAGDQGHD